MKEDLLLIFAMLWMFFGGFMSGYQINKKEYIRTELKHKHTIHCCKSDTLRSTYHTYIRINNGIDHLKTCRCYEN